MEAKFDEPKMLQGFGVDWTGYVPAGGQEWQDMFDAEILPEINQMIDERNKQCLNYRPSCLKAKVEKKVA